MIEKYKVPLRGYLFELCLRDTYKNPINTELTQDIILKMVDDPAVPKKLMSKYGKTDSG